MFSYPSATLRSVVRGSRIRGRPDVRSEPDVGWCLWSGSAALAVRVRSHERREVRHARDKTQQRGPSAARRAGPRPGALAPSDDRAGAGARAPRTRAVPRGREEACSGVDARRTSGPSPIGAGTADPALRGRKGLQDGKARVPGAARDRPDDRRGRARRGRRPVRQRQDDDSQPDHRHRPADRRRGGRRRAAARHDERGRARGVARAATSASSSSSSSSSPR